MNFLNSFFIYPSTNIRCAWSWKGQNELSRELLGWSWFMCFPIKYDRFSPPVWLPMLRRWMHLKPIFSNVWESYRDFITQKDFWHCSPCVKEFLYQSCAEMVSAGDFSHPAQLRSPTVKYHQRKNVPILLPAQQQSARNLKFTPFSSLSNEFIFQNISLKAIATKRFMPTWWKMTQFMSAIAVKWEELFIRIVLLSH